MESRFAELEAVFAEQNRAQYGFYRPVIGRVVEKFLNGAIFGVNKG